MNFVCDNCKAVRPFSGQPLACDFCGWQRNSASRQATNVPAEEPAQVWAGEQKVALGVILRVVIGGILVVGAVYLVAEWASSGKQSGLQTPGKYQLALKYNLTEDQVFMDPKPSGCDFTNAPLGEKHCHFEQDLNVVRECLTPNCPVKRVYVSWHKVRDEPEKQ